MSDFLYKRLENAFEDGYIEKPVIPEYVLNNLTSNFKIREYQDDALKFFIKDYETKTSKNKQIWDLFHMATGSGKTYMMAALMLFLYEKGYNNFIFFVNATNIVEKTKENFLNKEFKKYLFAKDIVINKKKIEINQVENFANTNDDAINIMFTTIQGLHDRLNTIRENSISYDDFEDKKIVLIADESHHLNASTKKSKKEKEDFEKDEKTWENTILNIYHKNTKNIILEFTATCELKNENIQEKYLGNPADIVYDYSLLKFRNSGYTKDLINLRTSLPRIERTIQAMLLSQYRLKLFEKNKIANSKPVILLKVSDNINDLENFYQEFIQYMQNAFNEKVIDTIKNQDTEIINKMFSYFDDEKITNKELVEELKLAFNEDTITRVHSKIPETELNKIQISVNDLENPKNPYRMIMTVDMLHEGWDVLNLFDIVRLYDKRPGKAAKTTVQEAQLIGRGARYFPFELSDQLNGETKFKRKFDGDVDNEMRICETLYYHCYDDSKYINELNDQLKETGFSFSEPKYDFEYIVKDNFKTTKIYAEGKLFRNKKIQTDPKTLNKIPDSFSIEVEKDLTKTSNTSKLIDGNIKSSDKDYKRTTYKVGNCDIRIVMKAIRQYPIYNFNVLFDYFPNLKSLTEFVTSYDYAARYEFTIRTTDEPTNLDIYEGLLEVFEKLSYKISKMKETYIGTKEFEEVPLNKIVVDTKRKKSIPENEKEEYQGEGISQNSPNVDKTYRLDLSKEDWFVYNDNFGTTEEKRFVRYFSTKIEELKKKYDEIYLIRNERNLSIFSFEDGSRFEPDYLLILIKNGMVIEQQQIFIEPKGEHLVKHDEWKEKFLMEIEKQANCIVYHNTRDEYKVLGLPFYTHENEEKFKKDFEEKLL